MTDFRNVSDHAEDLDGGRVVGIGQTFSLSSEELKSQFNKSKIEEGTFLKVPDAVEDEPTKKELLDRAKELEIEGRTAMDTDQLKTAIAEAEAAKAEAENGGNA